MRQLAWLGSPLGVAVVAAISTGLSVAARIVIASIDVPAPVLVFGQSDVYETWRDAGLAGHAVPYRDVGFAYPPIIGYIAGAISLVVTSARGYMIGWGLIVIACAAGTAALLAREVGPRRALAYWSLAPQLLLCAGINFDTLPALLATAAALRARRGRELRSSSLAALAAATKYFAAAFAPVLVLRALPHLRRATRVALVFVAVFVGVYLPAALAPHTQLSFASEYAYTLGANIDSIWAIPATLLRVAGIDPATPILVVTTAGMAATYLGLTLPRALRARDAAAGLGLALVTVLLWNRYYSPQYEIWLLPFFALLAVPRRTFALLTVADIGVFFSVFPLTLLLRPPDPLTAPFLALMTASVVLRHIALIALWRDITRPTR